MMCTYFRAASLSRLPISLPHLLSLSLCLVISNSFADARPGRAQLLLHPQQLLGNCCPNLLSWFCLFIYAYEKVRQASAAYSYPLPSLCFFFVCLAVFMLLFLSGGANGHSASAPAKGAAAASTRHRPLLLPCQCFVLSFSPLPSLSVCLAAFLFKHKFFIFLNQ